MAKSLCELDEELLSGAFQKCEHGHVFPLQKCRWSNGSKEDWYKFLSKYIQSKEQQTDLDDKYSRLNDDEFWEVYVDTVSELSSKYGVPEEYCPVCRKIKEYSQDPDWEKYLELKEKFKDISL